MEDIFTKINDRITETYSLQFQGFLYEFFYEDNKQFFEDIEVICKELIFNEFELIVNYDGYLEFEKNTQKQISDYCYEILELHLKPMKLDDIFEEIKLKHIDFNNNIESLRISITAKKDVFIYFGG